MTNRSRTPLVCLVALAASLWLTSCQSNPNPGAVPDDLVGAWRGKVQFKNGAFAAVGDLDFLYIFNAGGTMLESSNYDAAPPVTPAYGVWRRIGERQYEAKYEYYWTKAPASFDEIAKGGGWSPGGHGVLVQKITLAADGNSFESTIRYEVFDNHGAATDPASDASAQGVRVKF